MDATTDPIALHGRALLRRWLTEQNIRQTHFALRLGVAPSHLSKILSGEKGTSDSLKELIETETGGAVPFASWRPGLDLKEPPKPAEDAAA